MFETVSNADVSAWRAHLVDRAYDMFKDGAALSFSGGCDSALILFAAVEAGLKPRCYTLGHPRAVAEASPIAAALDVEHIIVPIPRRPFDEELREVTFLCDWRCASSVLPFVAVNMLIFPQLYDHIEEPAVVTGMMADHLYQTRWDSQNILREQGEEALNRRRIPRANDPDLTCFHLIDCAQRVLGKQVREFYDDAWQSTFFRQFTHIAINGAGSKRLARRAFEDYWCRNESWWRAEMSVATRCRDINADPLLCRMLTGFAEELGLEVGTHLPPRDADGLVAFEWTPGLPPYNPGPPKKMST